MTEMTETEYLSPEEIIDLFVSRGGRLTNLQLVKHFSARLQGPEEQSLINKEVLKRVTHHVATRRRQGQGSREGDGGKLLVLKNRFRDKTAVDIWSSLILTLPAEEINKLLPIRILEDGEEETDGEPGPLPSPLALTVSEVDKRKSVRDLTKNFDQFASESSVSLRDHLVEKNKKNKSSKTQRRPTSSIERDRNLPLSQEQRAWLKAAMRGDFSTLSRLARSEPGLVMTRDPSTGYTALHWAAKQGSVDIVKLLAGSHEMEPDVRTRGGYTPLMLAALGKKHEVYDLLVNSYKADETLRDFSGRRSDQYLERHYPTIPGVTAHHDLSHDNVLPDVFPADETDAAMKSRRGVARAATSHFISEFRESFRDIRGSFRENWMRSRSNTDWADQ